MTTQFPAKVADFGTSELFDQEMIEVVTKICGDKDMWDTTLGCTRVVTLESFCMPDSNVITLM